MWDIIFLLGLVLLVAGLVKRKTRWGKSVALVGTIGIIVSLLVAGPDMLEAFREGFREGYSD